MESEFTLPFHEFSSIDNTYSASNIELVNKIVPIDMLWYATEKVHGSNFSFTSNGEYVKCGKRTSYLGIDGLNDFYNSNIVYDKYSELIKDAFFKIKKLMYNNLEYVQVFGEIFGGDYNDTPKIKNNGKTIKPVQKEVLYCPDIEFLAFDIYVVLKSGQTFYLNVKECYTIFETVNIPHVKILFVNTLSNLLNLTPDFPTTIPQYYNLPDIPNNISEGYVFKPEIEFKTFKGSRIVLKHKSSKFLEKRVTKAPRLLIDNTLSNDEIRILQFIEQFICESRLLNILSKMTESEKLNSLRITGLLTKDAINDALKEMNDQDKAIYHDGKNKINSHLTMLSNKVREEHVIQHS